jgi:chitin synthase
MFFYLLAIPLFNFYIPIYSYWHFDDFSWGNTRVVVGDGKKQVISEDEEPFDPSSIPLKTWVEHEQQIWENSSQGSHAFSVLRYNHVHNTSSSYLYPHSVVSSNSRSISSSPSPYIVGNSSYSALTESNRSITPQLFSQETGPSVLFRGVGKIQGQGYCTIPSQQYPISPRVHQQMYLGSSASSAMIDIADETLASEIRFILSTNGLNITKKQIRDRLQESFRMNLSHKKDFISATIDSILNKNQ